MAQRDQSTHRRILDAAEKLFAEKGYKETTTREIVREAGASLSSLQAHFQSKENIYDEVCRRSMEKLSRLMRPTMDEAEYLDRQGLLYGEMAWHLLAESISKYVAWCFSDENRNAIMLINKEIVEGKPVPGLVEEKISGFFSAIQLLFMRCAETDEADWAALISWALFSSMLTMSDGIYRHGRDGRGRWSLYASMEENMYQMKSFLLLSLRSYLDIRRAHGPKNTVDTGEETRPNQTERMRGENPGLFEQDSI